MSFINLLVLVYFGLPLAGFILVWLFHPGARK